MPISDEVLRQLMGDDDLDTTSAAPKRGEDIFADTDYPREWSYFIGQDKAKEQLQVQIASALARDVRIEHTLLASGIPGVGKTTLATLLAYKAGVGLVQTTGPLDVKEARALISGMENRDILFIDEAHLLVQGSRTKADWMLPFLTEGVLYTKRGAEVMPDISVVAATTDVGKLPDTLVSRFMVQPEIVRYTTEEAGLIVQNLAGRMQVTGLSGSDYQAIAGAADNNPRGMRRVLTAVRDLGFAFPGEHPNLAKAFEYAGVSPDGLTTVARDILIVLLTSPDYTASIDSVKANLGEPGPIRYHEQQLLQRALVTVTGRGRKLTDTGVTRARQEINTRRNQ